MKILHISTSDTKGGGARSAFRLHQGLLKLGVESRMLVLHRFSKEASISKYEWPKDRIRRWIYGRKKEKVKNKLLAYKSTKPQGFELFSVDQTPFENLADQLADYDLINLHWVAGFVDIESLFSSLPKDKPIVWRLSDMNPLTGGCHYDAECGKYLTECQSCPQLGSTKNDDLSNEIWNRKKSVFEKIGSERFYFVTQSKWMAENTSKSVIFSKYNTTVIPNGLDASIFCPRDSSASREVFNIPKDKKVLLFVSDSITNKRKGLQFLIDAIDQLPNPDEIILCTIGRALNDKINKNKFIELGNISDDRLLSMAYSMADFFIIPSVQDNLPNTVIESLSCGTPVVGFPVGGIKDMITHGKNGYLCDEVSVESLATYIQKAVENSSIFDRIEIRKQAVLNYSQKVQAERMANLYTEIINKTNK